MLSVLHASMIRTASKHPSSSCDIGPSCIFCRSDCLFERPMGAWPFCRVPGIFQSFHSDEEPNNRWPTTPPPSAKSGFKWFIALERTWPWKIAPLQRKKSLQGSCFPNLFVFQPKSSNLQKRFDGHHRLRQAAADEAEGQLWAEHEGISVVGPGGQDFKSFE